MDVHGYAWAATIAIMVAILGFDIFVIGRRPHEPSMKEAGTAIGVFVASGRRLRPRGLGRRPARATPVSSSPAG